MVPRLASDRRYPGRVARSLGAVAYPIASESTSSIPGDTSVRTPIKVIEARKKFGVSRCGADNEEAMRTSRIELKRYGKRWCTVERPAGAAIAGELAGEKVNTLSLAGPITASLNSVRPRLARESSKRRERASSPLMRETP